jgi:membrane protease YdiL (CAAX protease family)
LYHASHDSAVEPGIAAMIVLVAMATYLMVPQLVPSALALIAAQVALVVVPIVAVLVTHPVRPLPQGEPSPQGDSDPCCAADRNRSIRGGLAALGLRGARPWSFVAAIAIGCTAWYVNMRLVALLPLPPRPLHRLEDLVERPPLAAALAMFALAPAVCEELLFRGVLARALGRRLSLGVAAALSGAVFAAYHLSLVQALPTLTLGFVLALLAIRADSVLPAMAAHAINNALAIVMSRRELPELTGWLDRHPTLALAGAAAATAAGIAIAVRGPA